MAQKFIENADNATVRCLGEIDVAHTTDLLCDEIGGDPMFLQDQPQLSGEASGKRYSGASGISTRRRVRSDTNKATCGFQNRTVAYQLPSKVSLWPGGERSGPMRSSNFLVQCR